MKIGIWKTVETDTPICSYDTAIDLIQLRKTSKQFYILKVIMAANESGFGLIRFRNLIYDTHPEYLLISVDLVKEVREFKSTWSLSIEEEDLLIFIHSLNNELSSWYSIISSNDFSKQIVLALKNYSKDEESLKDVIQLTNPNGSNNFDELSSITFTFSGITKPIKISNFLLVSNIIDCLKHGYDFEGDMRSNLLEVVTRFKEKIALRLFNFINSPNDIFYISSKKKTYEIIAEIFSFSGEPSNHDMVKTWIMRGSKNNP